MNSQRVTFLATPEFKAFLVEEAKREGVSVGELVRRRCEQRPSDDEAALAALTIELRGAVGEAKKALKDGLDETHAVLRELAAARQGAASRTPPGEPAARRARKVRA